MECKVQIHLQSVEHGSVLIETLWNVKTGNPKPQTVASKVLIETLWNVKKKRYKNNTYAGASINRNIVECKANLQRRLSNRFTVLIETLWNVKYFVSALL